MLQKISKIQDRDLELDDLRKEKRKTPVELTRNSSTSRRLRS